MASKNRKLWIKGLSGDFNHLLITFANILDQERGPILDPNCLKFMKKQQTTIFKKALLQNYLA